jgi:Spy/CpxP family protein refolding chaperone
MLLSSANFYNGEIEHEKFRKVTTMKLKLMPVFAYAIALTVAAAPLAVKAQPNQQNQPVPGQAQNQPQFAGVKITQQQQNQLAQIRSDARAQIEKLLTPQQLEQLKTATTMQSGQDRQAALAAMNLSQEQKNQLQTIIQSARNRAEAVLTPEQRQQMQQNIQQSPQQRSQ